MKKIIVVGSNSFSGGDFIEYLLEKGGFHVAGISRSENKLKPRRNFLFQRIDLNRDFNKLFKFIDRFRPNYIVNFAGLIEVASSWNYPIDYFTTNTLATVRLGNFLKDQKYLKKYIHISTPEVYGSCVNAKEDIPVNPSTPYAASKASADLFLQTLVKNYKFPMITIRSTNVYGPGQQGYRIIPMTIISLKLKKKIFLHGGGKAVKSYIHIRDVSKGEVLAIQKGKVGQIYHFSPDNWISARDLVKRICVKMKADFSKYVRNGPERPGQDKIYILDSSKARKELGWQPKISLDQGLDEVIDWVNENWESIKREPLEYRHKL